MFWGLRKAAFRANQAVMRLLANILKFREPELLTGAGSLRELPRLIRSRGIDNVLIVTDKVLMKLGILDGLLEAMEEN